MGKRGDAPHLFFAPVFVIFLAGLIGLGWFVWAGSSSPWGWECGVCFFGSTGFLMGLCSGCGSGRATGWCRESSSWRSRSWPGPFLTGAWISRLSFGDDCRGDILIVSSPEYKKTGGSRLCHLLPLHHGLIRTRRLTRSGTLTLLSSPVAYHLTCSITTRSISGPLHLPP